MPKSNFWVNEVDAVGGPLNYIKSSKDRIFSTTSSSLVDGETFFFMNERDCKLAHDGIYLSHFHQELVMRKDVDSSDIAKLIKKIAKQVHSDGGDLDSDERVSFTLELSGLAIVLAMKIG